jgi:hypothetical protein
MKPKKLLFFIFLLLEPVSNLAFPDSPDSGSDSIAEASVSVGLYLTSMAGKELGVSQLKTFFQNSEDQVVSQPGEFYKPFYNN